MSNWTVGRSPDCDIVVDFPSVSRRHATIEEIGTDFEVCDLGSTSGTHIIRDGNWARIMRATLAPDDPIRLGGYETTTRTLLATVGFEFSMSRDTKPTSLTAFVCHASEDQHVAEELVESIEAKGHRCWVAPRDVRPGRDYGAEIVRGIERSNCLILILSNSANQSPFVKREVERAVSKQKPVFPVRIENVPPAPGLELFISGTHWIDAWQGRLPEHFERLAQAISGGFVAPSRTKSRRRLARALPWVAGGVVALAVLALVPFLLFDGAGNNGRVAGGGDRVGSVGDNDRVGGAGAGGRENGKGVSGRTSGEKNQIRRTTPPVATPSMTQTVAGVSVNLKGISLSNDKKSIIASLKLTNKNNDTVLVVLISNVSSFVIPGVVDNYKKFTNGISQCGSLTSNCLRYGDEYWSRLEPGSTLGGTFYTVWRASSGRPGMSLAVGLNIRLAVRIRNESKAYDVSFDGVELK